MRTELAKLLRSARGYGVLTQQQLALRIGVSRRAVASYEGAEVEPPIGVVLLWLRVCRRPISDLEKLAEVADIELWDIAARSGNPDDVPRRSARRNRPAPAPEDD